MYLTKKLAERVDGRNRALRGDVRRRHTIFFVCFAAVLMQRCCCWQEQQHVAAAAVPVADTSPLADVLLRYKWDQNMDQI